MFLIKKLVSNLVMPVPLTCILLALALTLRLAGYRRSATSVAAGGVLLLLLAAWGPVADSLLGPLEARHPPVLHAGQHEEIHRIVVLGSGYQPQPSLPITSRLGDSAVVRLVEGVRLYRQMPGAELVLTGGAAFGEGSVARGYETLALALGVPRDDLVVLAEPRDTASEARAVEALMDRETRLLLVTSASHMERAMRHFRRVGLDPVAAPTRHKSLREDRSRLDYWVPGANHLRKTERALHEYMGLLALEVDH